MKKTKICGALCLAAIMAATIGLTACGGTSGSGNRSLQELSHYSGEDKDVNGNTVYNNNLFYSNQLIQGYPDPDVLDDTAQTGYYYLYGTGGHTVMRSKNLAEWENVDTILDLRQGELSRAARFHNWAPEVVYDEETKLYYYYFSAKPETVTGNDGDACKDDKVDQAAAGVVSNILPYNMYVATSSSPTGPFTIVNFSDKHNYNTQPNKELTREQAQSGDYAVASKNGKYYEAAFPHYWAKYCVFSPDELSKVMQKGGIGDGEIPEAGYFGTIDPHPYVDPVSHKKYMYFKSEDPFAWNIHIGVEMEDWLTPKWETAKYITVDGYYTVEDWKNGENRGVSYEQSRCNEGPHMIYHEDKNGKGLYYFTFSVNDYGMRTYQVATAVADSPLGDFRKLTEAEGALLLSAQPLQSKSVSGAGHHSFVTMGDQLFMIYHRHRDFNKGGADRYVAIDEVKWITVKDKFGNDMDVPYANGPTDSLQPLPEQVSGYKNIAPEAELTCTDTATETECAVDGLLSLRKTGDRTFRNYIREAYISQTATFTFEFETARTIRAIMIYQSAFEASMFRTVSRIELTLKDGSKRYIDNLEFDVEQHCQLGGEFNDKIVYVKSGTAVFAEFYDIEVTSVKITVDVPEGQERTGISEIRILGKA